MIASVETYQRILQAFKENGNSLNGYCKQRGISYHWARACLIGSGQGLKARILFKEITQDAGIEQDTGKEI